jgi:heat shock protein HslJ
LLAAAVLVGTAVAAFPDSAGLAGSQWGYPLEPGVTDTRYVRFAVDGELFGNGGCNAIRGTYEQTGNAITIGPLATTRMACAEEVMAGETSFIEALTSAHSVEATHLKLVLLDADGRELARLVRQDWD